MSYRNIDAVEFICDQCGAVARVEGDSLYPPPEWRKVRLGDRAPEQPYHFCSEAHARAWAADNLRVVGPKPRASQSIGRHGSEAEPRFPVDD